MCKCGDIILVYEYKSQGSEISKHSFVVINDKNGIIEGLSYDIICNVLSSFKDEFQRQHKLAYPGNFPVDTDDVKINNGNNRNGYIKADQFYYFDKNKLKYKVIGTMNEAAYGELVDFIMTSNFKIENVLDNL